MSNRISLKLQLVSHALLYSSMAPIRSQNERGILLSISSFSSFEPFVAAWRLIINSMKIGIEYGMESWTSTARHFCP